MDLQPHTVAEALVDRAVCGACEIAHVLGEPFVGAMHALADCLVVARRVRLQLEHLRGPAGSEQLDIVATERFEQLGGGQSCLACLRLNSEAAWLNTSITFSKPRSTAAMKRSRFVGNRLKTYGWETPARRAMRSTAVPCSPPRANSSIAAAITASRLAGVRTRRRVCLVGVTVRPSTRLLALCGFESDTRRNLPALSCGGGRRSRPPGNRPVGIRFVVRRPRVAARGRAGPVRWRPEGRSRT